MERGVNINIWKPVYKSKKNIGNSRKIIIYTILSLIIVFCIGEIIFSKYYFEVTYYNIESRKIEKKYGLYRFLTFIIVNLGITMKMLLKLLKSRNQI